MIGNKLEPFKFWCQKVLPNVYDDSLSYYEYLCKLNEYLNEVIGQINTLTDNMSDYEEDLTATWLETKEYIDNYFNNLDVQQEINNKLDQMASSGTLSTLIAPFVSQEIGGVVADQIGATVANQIGGTVANQIDAVVAEQIDEPTATATSAWLTAHVDPVGSAVIVDNTLTISGAAADAKVTGDKINEINVSLYDSQEKIIGDKEYRNILYPNTLVANSNTGTNRVYVIENKVINVGIKEITFNVGSVGTGFPEDDNLKIFLMLKTTGNTYKIYREIDATAVNHIVTLQNIPTLTNTVIGFVGTVQYQYGVSICKNGNALVTDISNNTVTMQNTNQDFAPIINIVEYTDRPLIIDNSIDERTKIKYPSPIGATYQSSSECFIEFNSVAHTLIIHSSLVLFKGAYITNSTKQFDLSQLSGWKTLVYSTSNNDYVIRDYTVNYNNSDIFLGIFNTDMVHFYFNYDILVDGIRCTGTGYPIKSIVYPTLNKKLNCLGDSITVGVGSTGNNTGWTTRLQRCGFSLIRNYGVVGSDINQDMDTRYGHMDNDADYITVFGGINDFHHNKPLGQMGAGTNASFYGSLAILIKGLIEKYPKGKILFMTPIKCYGYTYTNSQGHTLTFPNWNEQNTAGFVLKDYRDAIVEQCEYYCVPYLDLFNMSGICAQLEYVNGTWVLSSDGVHPTNDGYQIIADKITEKLISI